ncbi:MAG: transposase [Clostridia bacterium]|nr:transposase [Clostridia bacterium]
MSRRPERKFTKEFKLSAVYLMLSKTMRPKDIFAMLNVDRQTVYRWVKEFKEGGESAFEEKRVTDKHELRRLQKELADVKMENEILKKATAYFAERNQKK